MENGESGNRTRGPGHNHRGYAGVPGATRLKGGNWIGVVPWLAGFADSGGLSRAEQFAVEDTGEPLLPVGWGPAEVGGEELVAVAVDEREEGGCGVVAVAACA